MNNIANKCFSYNKKLFLRCSTQGALQVSDIPRFFDCKLQTEYQSPSSGLPFSFVKDIATGPIAAPSLPLQRSRTSLYQHEVIMPFGARNFAKAKKGKKEKKSQKGNDDDDEEEGKISRVEIPEFSADEVSKRMDSHVDAMLAEMAKLRSNKASPGMLESLMVQAYGDSMPLKDLGLVTAKDQQTLSISLYDASTASAVERAITQSSLGFNPTVATDSILVTVPSLSAEAKKEVAKIAAAAAENAKKAIRGRRKDAMDALKAAKKLGRSEDEVVRDEKQVQNLTDKAIAKIDSLVEAKKKELTALV